MLIKIFGTHLVSTDSIGFVNVWLPYEHKIEFEVCAKNGKKVLNIVWQFKTKSSSNELLDDQERARRDNQFKRVMDVLDMLVSLTSEDDDDE